MKVEFGIGGYIMKAHDAAYVLEDEDPLVELVDTAISAISTNVEITCGGVTMHLAAWQDPDHWSEDWEAVGVDPEDVSGFVAAQMKGES